MKKRILCTLLCLTMVAGLLTGCSTSGTEDTKGAATGTAVSDDTAAATTDQDKGEVTLTWAVFETDNYTAELWQSIIDAFEADNPGIKIEKILMTGDSRAQFLKTMLAANNMPDINVDPADLATTDGIYAEVPQELLAKYEDSAVVSFSGKNTLVPAYKALRTQCYYHKDQFAAAGITEEPKTWDEFIAACDKLEAAGFTPLMGAGAADIWATSFGWWTGVANSEIMTAYPEFNQNIIDGTVKWTDKVIADNLKAWQSLIDAGYYHKGSMSFSYTQAAEEFNNGSSAMFMDGSWAAATYDTNGVTTKDMGVFVVPTPSGAFSYCTMPQYWGVSEACKNKEAAFAFCEYVLGGNVDIYRKYLQADGSYSVTKEPVTYEMKEIQTEFAENYKDYALVPEIMKVVGDTKMPSGFEDFISKSFQNIFAGADVDSELATWDAEFARLTAK